MIMDIEELVRDAQRRQADRAVDPDRVRAGLPAHTARLARRRRAGIAVATIAVAGVVAAAAVPAVSFWTGTRPGPPSPLGPAGPGKSTTAAPVAPDKVTAVPPAPLRFRPTRIPPGLGEHERYASLDPTGEVTSVSRTWRDLAADGTVRPEGARRLTLDARRPLEPAEPEGSIGKPVQIGTVTGFYHGQVEEKAYVVWRADADTVISVQHVGLDLSEAELVAIARSVQPDPATMELPLRIGHLPAGMTMQSVDARGESPTSWAYSTSGDQPLGEPPTKGSRESKESARTRTLSVSVGTGTAAPDGGEATTVGGRPARVVLRDTGVPTEMRYVVVDLGGGRLLTVLGMELTADDLLTVADSIEVTGDPDLSWIGR